MDMFHRQLDWFNPDEIEMPVLHIIGCGGINSFVVFYLAQMGFTDIVIWDYDKVETHNISNQNYMLSHIGMDKTAAIAQMIKDKVGIDVRIKNRFFTETSKIKDENVVMVLGTDNITSRKIAWEHAKENDNVKWFIDGRLGGLAFNVLTANPHDVEDIKAYESTLFAEGEAMELPCTAQAIIFVGTNIAAIMCQQIFSYVTDKPTYKNIVVDHMNGIVQYDKQAVMYGMI